VTIEGGNGTPPLFPPSQNQQTSPCYHDVRTTNVSKLGCMIENTVGVGWGGGGGVFGVDPFIRISLREKWSERRRYLPRYLVVAIDAQNNSRQSSLSFI
jgi:hypothetical protein